LSSRYISELFHCVEPTRKSPFPPTTSFIANILRRSLTPKNTVIYALCLLTRLSAMHPNFRFKHGHVLFLSALILANKLLHDEVPTNLAWCEVSTAVANLPILNMMERDICQRLDWNLAVKYDDLVALENDLR
ncbi:hypothetical protein BV25DRAFT_1763856, partial [Artomyces pyxidatus]